MNAPWTRTEASALQRLQAENEALREENAYLRSELGQSLATDELTRIQRHFGVTATHARIILSLFRRRSRTMTPVQLEALIAQGRDHAKEVTSNQAAVHIHQLRARIGKDAIVSCRPAGYSLSPSMREHVDQLLQGWP